MKTIITLCFFICAFSAPAQIVSGLYSGTLKNDSTKKIQQYELALTDYRGKIGGYSYTTFVSNDTFYYSIKRVKALRQGDKLIVEDEKMIVNNFPESPAKGVKQINTIQLTNEDTLRTANGTWTTTQTKIYYSLKGGMDMRINADSSQSALIGHLKELGIVSQQNLANYEVADTKSKEKEEAAKKAAAEKKAKDDLATKERNEKQKEKTDAKTQQAIDKQAKEDLAKKEQAQKEKEEQEEKAREALEEKAREDVAKREKLQFEKEKQEQARQEQAQKDLAKAARLKDKEARRIEEEKIKQRVAKEKEEAAKTVTPAATVTIKIPYTERKINTLKPIEITADSILLSIYDNGVIDGDSISIYLNGETIVSNIKLTATATKKWIVLPKTETIEIILVAENLGTLPPNTGLVVVKDGEQNYQVHFSADLQTNAAIIFKRKLK